MAKKPAPFHMRLDAESEWLLDAIAQRFGLTRSAVIRMALRRWAHAEALVAPPEVTGKVAA